MADAQSATLERELEELLEQEWFEPPEDFRSNALIGSMVTGWPVRFASAHARVAASDTALRRPSRKPAMSSISRLRSPVLACTASRVSSCSASRVAPSGPMRVFSWPPTTATDARARWRHAA